MENVICRIFNTSLNYEPIFKRMYDFTMTRSIDTHDEIWFLQHNPVYTQGYTGGEKNILKTTSTKIIKTDRGGQITYHAPGQLIVYPLINLSRANIDFHKFIRHLEKAIIELLNSMNIESHRIIKAPGIYIQNNKICSIGIRIKRGCSYHGLALNVNMEMSPFENIIPCGIENIKMTQLSNYIPNITVEDVIPKLVILLKDLLGYSSNILIQD